MTTTTISNLLCLEQDVSPSQNGEPLISVGKTTLRTHSKDFTIALWICHEAKEQVALFVAHPKKVQEWAVQINALFPNVDCDAGGRAAGGSLKEALNNPVEWGWVDGRLWLAASVETEDQYQKACLTAEQWASQLFGELAVRLSFEMKALSNSQEMGAKVVNRALLNAANKTDPAQELLNAWVHECWGPSAQIEFSTEEAEAEEPSNMSEDALRMPVNEV